MMPPGRAISLPHFYLLSSRELGIGTLSFEIFLAYFFTVSKMTFLRSGGFARVGVHWLL
jgi:hypothetical protein